MRKSLCCISLKLQERGIKAQIMTRQRFLLLENTLAINTLSKRVLNNLGVTHDTIKYCIKKNWNYRISSNLFPLATLPDANISFDILPDKPMIDTMCTKIALLIKNSNIRCSMHPDQFVVPASANPAVAAKSLVELKHHADLMDRMGLPRSYEAPINIHMNSFKGDLTETAKRFIDIYKTLPDAVTSRLVLELEDKPNSWGLINLHDLIYQKTGIPITYDSHHFRLNNPENISPEKAILMCMETWGKYKPLFHYSNGRSGPTDRAHSDYVYILHKELFENDVDVEFEFKAKDYAIEKFEQTIENKINSNC
jgi:UV DNA damage endonuclease